MITKNAGKILEKTAIAKWKRLIPDLEDRMTSFSREGVDDCEPYLFRIRNIAPSVMDEVGMIRRETERLRRKWGLPGFVSPEGDEKTRKFLEKCEGGYTFRRVPGDSTRILHFVAVDPHSPYVIANHELFKGKSHEARELTDAVMRYHEMLEGVENARSVKETGYGALGSLTRTIGMDGQGHIHPRVVAEEAKMLNRLAHRSLVSDIISFRRESGEADFMAGRALGEGSRDIYAGHGGLKNSAYAKISRTRPFSESLLPLVHDDDGNRFVRKRVWKMPDFRPKWSERCS